MSNYLDNLAIRSFGLATAIQPVVAPAFKPGRETSDPFVQPAPNEFSEEPASPSHYRGRSPQKSNQFEEVRPDQASFEASAFAKGGGEADTAPSLGDKTEIQREPQIEPPPSGSRKGLTERVAPRTETIPVFPDGDHASRRLETESPAVSRERVASRQAGDSPAQPATPTLSLPAKEVIRTSSLPPTLKGSAERISGATVSSTPRLVAMSPTKVFPADSPATHRAKPDSTGISMIEPASTRERVMSQRANEPLEPEPPAHSPTPISKSGAVMVKGGPDGKFQSGPPNPLDYALRPKPGARPLAPVTAKRRPGLIPSGSPSAANGDVPAGETVVNVAIGRLEVRSMPVRPTSSGRRRDAPQVMSLDDYLRQRSGGSR